MTTIEIQTRGRGPTFEVTHFKDCPDYARSSYRCEPGCCDDGLIADGDCTCPACIAEWEAAGAKCGCGNRKACPPCDVLRCNAMGPPTLEQHEAVEDYDPIPAWAASLSSEAVSHV